MVKVYVGAGHGTGTTGGYDPGAVAGGLVEEKINEQVALTTAAALRRCGFTVLVDSSAEQYDYMQAVKVANDWHADYAMEIHHNIGGGGSMALVADPVTSTTRAAASLIVSYLNRALGTRNLGVVSRTREYFNRATVMPSSIPEVACLDGDNAIIKSAGYATKAGEAIAHGLADHFKVPWKPPAPAEMRLEYPLGRAVLVQEPGHPEVWLVAHVINPADLVAVKALLAKASLPTGVRSVTGLPKP